MTKVGILRSENYPGLSMRALNTITCILIRRGRKTLTTKLRTEANVKMEAEIEVIMPPAKNVGNPSMLEQETDFPLEILEGLQPFPHLDFAQQYLFWTSNH